MGRIPAQLRNRGGEGIKEQLFEIETMSLIWLVRTAHAVGIELTGADPFYPDVPYITGAVVR